MSSALVSRGTRSRRSMRSSSGPESFWRYCSARSDRHRQCRRGSPSNPQGQGLAAATNVNRAGNSTEPTARVTTTRPSSSGCRRPSTASRRNSVNSSRNRTPWLASETSPGRRYVVPPPSKPACEMEWCGDRNGRDRKTPSPPANSPATEWSWVVSSASSRVSLGKMVVTRRASMVLPAPGDPTSSALWPPAAATSSARRA